MVRRLAREFGVNLSK
ncbi:hypothetical protein ACT691_06245 [Vibrio metschnikovii]